MQRDIDVLKEAAVATSLSCSQTQGGNALKRSRSSMSEADTSYFENLLKEKQLKITVLEGERAQIEYLLTKQE